ncbi:hypothetical protein HK097_000854 [Rhizophlyctis rosea]|uniref:mannan endo-1,4-beta-mannosidase n=1 Tax=Rhizophlyctis rosea TaxID=64517 RepID=A0AAD5X156_9FUNG|nr:hypothetical protein HK097_000854 [Rhizophlyctis rosea]
MRFLSLAATALAAATAVLAQTSTVPEGFVTRCGTKFCLDGKPWSFAGANTYDVFTYGSGSGATETQFMDKTKIDRHFDNLKRNGVMVLRTWMFSHETWHGFEITKGVYNEDQFALFDYVIEAARRTGIKLIPVFENYWEAYGGIDTRLEWEGLTGGHPGRAQFFDKTKCPGCFESYKNYVKYALNRVNHYSNIAYKDDPAIMAWELMNEPRYQDVSAQENKSGTTLRKWVDEMGAFIKSIDSNHLLGTGLEAHESALGFGGDEGNPFVYIHQSPYIDMTSAHPYTDEPWAGPMTLAQTLTFISKVIDLSHNTVKKPFFMGEFNFHSAGTDGAYNATLRAEWWSAVYDLLEQEEVAGSAFWWFSYANTDPTFGVANGDPILKVFVEHGNVLRVKNGDDEIALPTPTPSPVPQCEDVYPFPEDGYTCQQQAGWGKCSESWLQGYCNDSCGRCPGTGTASPTATPTGNTGCTDIAPDTEYTCAQQAEWGKCTEDWMEGWCLSSCGKCPSATITVPSTSSPTPTGDCVDVAPDNEYTCAQQAEWGKCTEDWMAGWCKKSCGTCPGMTTTTTTFPTCTATATPRASNAPIRVMALGDSITGSPGCWRAYLWQKLNQAGLSSMVDFVGTLKGQGCPNVPSYDGENEGHGGFLVTNVARDGSLINWLCSTFPDVVMMHFGTNDVWSSKSPAVILDAFTTLVNQMRANNPNVQIIVAQILPMNPTGCADCNSRVIAFNAAIPAWIEKTSTSRSPIVIVDQFSGFDTGANTGDGVHPNDSGNVKVGNSYFARSTG